MMSDERLDERINRLVARAFIHGETDELRKALAEILPTPAEARTLLLIHKWAQMGRGKGLTAVTHSTSVEASALDKLQRIAMSDEPRPAALRSIPASSLLEDSKNG